MLKYIGNGSFLTGVPARDLSDEEVKKFGGERRLIATGLWIKQKTENLEKPDKEGDE